MTGSDFLFTTADSRSQADVEGQPKDLFIQVSGPVVQFQPRPNFQNLSPDGPTVIDQPRPQFQNQPQQYVPAPIPPGGRAAYGPSGAALDVGAPNPGDAAPPQTSAPYDPTLPYVPQQRIPQRDPPAQVAPSADYPYGNNPAGSYNPSVAQPWNPRAERQDTGSGLGRLGEVGSLLAGGIGTMYYRRDAMKTAIESGHLKKLQPEIDSYKTLTEAHMRMLTDKLRADKETLGEPVKDRIVAEIEGSERRYLEPIDALEKAPPAPTLTKSGIDGYLKGLEETNSNNPHPLAAAEMRDSLAELRSKALDNFEYDENAVEKMHGLASGRLAGKMAFNLEKAGSDLRMAKFKTGGIMALGALADMTILKADKPGVGTWIGDAAQMFVASTAMGWKGKAFWMTMSHLAGVAADKARDN